MNPTQQTIDVVVESADVLDTVVILSYLCDEITANQSDRKVHQLCLETVLVLVPRVDRSLEVQHDPPCAPHIRWLGGRQSVIIEEAEGSKGVKVVIERDPTLVNQLAIDVLPLMDGAVRQGVVY